MPSAPLIVFRCDGSPEIGSGHVMRCLTLAQTLRKKKYEIVFLSSEETLKTVPALRDNEFSVQHEEKLEYADWLIVDHYGLDTSYESNARNWTKNIMVIDDLADRSHDCDVLLDQTYGRKTADYKALVPDGCKILTGAQYALLREEFSELRQGMNRDFSNADRILISFGGVNPKSSTEYALSMIEKYKNKSLHIDVVTSSGAKSLSSIKKEVEKIKDMAFHTIDLHLDTPDMAALMTKADLCIGAGGTTSWERCCLKLPSITLELADNQKFVLESLGKAGAIQNMGPIETIDKKEFLGIFSEFIGSTERLAGMSEKAGAICTGDGVDRVFCYLMKEGKTKSGENVTLRVAGENDCKLIFDWQVMPEIRQHARNPAPPSWEDHQHWFAKSLSNTGRKIFIVEGDKKPAGVVRLDKQDKEERKDIAPSAENIYEVSILIDPAMHGQGIGLAALALLRDYEPDAALIAEVLPENKASHILFDKAGYKPVNATWHASHPHVLEGKKSYA